MSQPIVEGQQVWCPSCKSYVQLLKVRSAAKLIDVHNRTIYRYIEEGLVFAIKTVGNRYRVCSNCLLRQNSNA